MARHVERWTDGVEEDKGSPTSVDDRFADGQLDVLRDIAAQLRQGDYLRAEPSTSR